MAEKAHIAEARAAVQHNQRWVRRTLATNQPPLVEPTKSSKAHFRDAAWKDRAILRTKEWRAPENSQRLPHKTKMVKLGVTLPPAADEGVILAFWSGPAVAVNFGPPGRVLATLRGWGNGSVAG